MCGREVWNECEGIVSSTFPCYLLFHHCLKNRIDTGHCFNLTLGGHRRQHIFFALHSWNRPTGVEKLSSRLLLYLTSLLLLYLTSRLLLYPIARTIYSQKSSTGSTISGPSSTLRHSISSISTLPYLRPIRAPHELATPRTLYRPI